MHLHLLFRFGIFNFFLTCLGRNQVYGACCSAQMAKWPKKQLKPVLQSKKHAPRAYYSNIYTVYEGCHQFCHRWGWFYGIWILQVFLCQKYSFLHQLTKNMRQIVHWITSSVQENYMFRTFCVHKLFVFFCFDIQNNLCTQHVLSLLFSFTELVIQWAIFCHIVG